jgi:signal transduction histidine kinase
VWNWEGGLWIQKWQDIKLVNLRATARINALGNVQWGGVITNITQSLNEKREIEESHKQLAELSSHMSLVKEQERLRIAREIHDDLGGNLTAIKMGLTSLLNALPKDEKILIEKTKQLELIVDKTFDDAHRITSDLRPNVLELGVVAALEWQANEFEKQIGIPCDFLTNDENIDLNSDKAIVLFRICQEATSNIAKHAKANLVDIKLISLENYVTMTVHDDGVGIIPANKLKKNAFGLRGMAERVSSVGGELSIESLKGKGTTITVKIPIS